MLGAEYVEYIHDELVSKLWPGSDPIASGEARSRELLESATARPFHSAFGQDAYPTVFDKTAVLFHSLIANHPFYNGNKRTAVLALHYFLLANGYLVFLSNAKVYGLAERTASYRQRGLSHEQSIQGILDALRDFIIPLRVLKRVAERRAALYKELYAEAMKVRRLIRRDTLNKLMPIG